jgi:aminocarboxymuconate-semialdehyde decarboxylase
MTLHSEDVMLHTCHPSRPVGVGTSVPRLPWRTIDVHCHILSLEVEGVVAQHPERLKAAALEAEASGVASFKVNVAQVKGVLPKLTSIEDRLRDMDSMGVDVQVISPTPTQYYYWAEPDLADVISGHLNDRISALCTAHPDRFLGFGAVTLQYPERAAEQLETLVRHQGFRGVEVSTRVNGRDIADRFFDPFWARAEEVGAVVFIHPLGTTMGARLAEHYLVNIIGQPLETTICLSKLIFDGALDRHPGLKIIAAHGGGYLPAYCGRSDHAHAVRRDSHGCVRPPSEYLRKLWFDTVVYDPAQLRRLVEQVGIDRIVTGSDYPFDMGEYNPSGMVASFSAEEQRKILGANAASLLGMPAPNL